MFAARCSTASEPLLIRYSFTIHNPAPVVVHDAGFWTCAPLDGPSGLACASLQVSHPHEVSRDAVGNRILRVQLDPLPPYGTALVSVQAVMETAAAVEGADPSPYLEPREPFNFRQSVFEDKAPRLVNVTPAEKPEALYRWVRDFMIYGGFDPVPHDAAWALERGRGDCTEYASLYTALCRREGIPARMLGGFVCSDSQVLDPTAYHNWSEYYHDGRWILADPLKRVFGDAGRSYVAMQVMPEGAPDPAAWFGVGAHGLQVRMNNE